MIKRVQAMLRICLPLRNIGKLKPFDLLQSKSHCVRSENICLRAIHTGKGLGIAEKMKVSLCEGL